MNQFIRFPIQVITSGIIEFMEKSHLRVYICLDSHKNRNSWQAFPSLATIKSEIRMNTSTIQGAIKDLIEWGLIKKAHIKREKGRGYRIVYTIIKEPSLKKPHKKIKKKISCDAKRKRDLKGRFTDMKQPTQRTVLNALKQPNDMADIHEEKSKQPNDMATTNKPYHMDDTNKPNDSATIQSLTSINQYKKDLLQNNLHKGKKLKSKSKAKSKPLTDEINLKPKKPKLDTSEKAWAKGIDNLIAEKNKPKWPDEKKSIE